MLILTFVYAVFTLLVLARSWNAWIWDVGSLLYFTASAFMIEGSWIFSFCMASIFIVIAILVHVEKVRSLISKVIFKRAIHSIPKLSTTEEEALNAGDTWFEKDVFTGTIDWQALSNVSSELTEEEQAFLNNETDTLCSMIDEWSIKQHQDLPENVWNYLKEQGFLGLVIAKEYGGKGFSARAHSDIVLKVASRSGVAAVTVMVPNSLGPGELLQHYGTDEQKAYYLPRLAKGIEIPCFALTEPNAGSDATSIGSQAIVIKHKVDDQEILALRLSLDKRWITLAPIATLIGLAVQLKDPEGLLQGVGEEGITCLLMSRNTKNLEIGNRHLPADQPFMNGTIRGENIIVPLSSIIGGQINAGHGWRMLVECLSIGRSISLPTLASASSGVAYVTTGAFSRIRKQFKVEIGQFEGVEEKLAEIAGLQYMVNATRLLTAAAVDQHKKPSVASAITKYFNTELARITLNDAMDVHAGRAVVEGPRNYLINYYQGIPISVTVEGANIMSRNLLIFGQGAMACHPFIREEFYAVSQNNQARFHELLWQHVQYMLRNFAKALGSAWTGGWLLRAPQRQLHREYQRLSRLSHAFAWLADVALIYLGGSLKRKERLSARLADGMSYLYIAVAVLLYAKRNNHDSDQQLHAKWAVSYCFYQAQKSLIAFCRNISFRPLGWLLRAVVFPFGQTMHYPSDKLDHKLAHLMMTNNVYREQILEQIYLSGDSEQPIDRVENAFQALIKHEHLYKKLGDFRRCSREELLQKIRDAVSSNALTADESQALLALEQARWDAILVDEFTFESMKHKIFKSVTNSRDKHAIVN